MKSKGEVIPGESGMLVHIIGGGGHYIELDENGKLDGPMPDCEHCKQDLKDLGAI